jgi:acetyltransferase-like isoleucine patch superfamily enzyme
MIKNHFPFISKIKRFFVACIYYGYNHFTTHIPIYAVRHFYLRHLLNIAIGKHSSVQMGCFITGNNIKIGDHSIINRYCYLDGRVGIEIGDNVSISPWVYIISLSHDVQSKTFATTGGKVVMKDYVWLGARALVLPNVILGKGVVVGAGSVVAKNVKDFTIVGGVPAKKIGERNKSLNYCIECSPFFDTDII